MTPRCNNEDIHPQSSTPAKILTQLTADCSLGNDFWVSALMSVRLALLSSPEFYTILKCVFGNCSEDAAVVSQESEHFEDLLFANILYPLHVIAIQFEAKTKHVFACSTNLLFSPSTCLHTGVPKQWICINLVSLES